MNDEDLPAIEDLPWIVYKATSPTGAPRPKLAKPAESEPASAAPKPKVNLATKPVPAPEPTAPAATPTPAEEETAKPTEQPHTDRVASWWGDKSGKYNWNASSGSQFGGGSGPTVVGRTGRSLTAYDQGGKGTTPPDESGDAPGRPPLPVSPGSDEYLKTPATASAQPAQHADVGAQPSSGFFSRLFQKKRANAPAAAPTPSAQLSSPNGNAAQPQPVQPLPAVTTVHPDVQRAITDFKARGTRSDAFKQFFGDWENEPEKASKVVHPATGEPQPTFNLPDEATRKPGAPSVPTPVYHGTPNGVFHVFDKNKIANPEHLLFGPGFYFTEDPKAAEVFARGGQSEQAKGSSPTVMSYYLKAHNPFDVDKHKINPLDLPPLDRATVRASYVQKALAEEGRSAALEAGQEFDAGKVGFGYRELTSDKGVGGLGASKTGIQELLRKKGYDALTLQADDVGEPGKNRYWIVFDGNQAKSVNNRGTFDMNAQHVLKALGLLPAPDAIALASALTGVRHMRRRAQARAAILTKGFDLHTLGLHRRFACEALVAKALRKSKKSNPQQASLFDDEDTTAYSSPSEQPRETSFHDGKRPGEFASRGSATSPANAGKPTSTPAKSGWIPGAPAHDSEKKSPLSVDELAKVAYSSDASPKGGEKLSEGTKMKPEVKTEPVTTEPKAHPAAALAAKHGRTIRGDGKTVYYTRNVGHGKRAEVEKRGVGISVGDVIDSKKWGGPMLVTKVGKPFFISDDHIEDADAWSEYPDGPGWYATYEAVPVNEVEKETAARTAKETAAKETADAAAKAKSAAADKWADVSGHPTVDSLPAGLPTDLTWEIVSEDLYGKNGYGKRQYIATLPNGTKIGKTTNSSYDDHREWFNLPKSLVETPEAKSAEAVTKARHATSGVAP